VFFFLISLYHVIKSQVYFLKITLTPHIFQKLVPKGSLDPQYTFGLFCHSKLDPVLFGTICHGFEGVFQKSQKKVKKKRSKC
jgi:hypothetical protein